MIWLAGGSENTVMRSFPNNNAAAHTALAVWAAWAAVCTNPQTHGLLNRKF